MDLLVLVPQMRAILVELQVGGVDDAHGKNGEVRSKGE
jgi:hypothetical protein